MNIRFFPSKTDSLVKTAVDTAATAPVTTAPAAAQTPELEDVTPTRDDLNRNYDINHRKVLPAIQTALTKIIEKQQEISVKEKQEIYNFLLLELSSAFNGAASSLRLFYLYTFENFLAAFVNTAGQDFDKNISEAIKTVKSSAVKPAPSAPTAPVSPSSKKPNIETIDTTLNDPPEGISQDPSNPMGVSTPINPEEASPVLGSSFPINRLEKLSATPPKLVGVFGLIEKGPKLTIKNVRDFLVKKWTENETTDLNSYIAQVDNIIDQDKIAEERARQSPPPSLKVLDAFTQVGKFLSSFSQGQHDITEAAFKVFDEYGQGDSLKNFAAIVEKYFHVKIDVTIDHDLTGPELYELKKTYLNWYPGVNPPPPEQKAPRTRRPRNTVNPLAGSSAKIKTAQTVPTIVLNKLPVPSSLRQ